MQRRGASRQTWPKTTVHAVKQLFKNLFIHAKNQQLEMSNLVLM